MLNDPTKDQIPSSELVGQDEGAKVTESAGNFSNHLQNQQGLILATVASKSKWKNFFGVDELVIDVPAIEKHDTIRRETLHNLPEQLKTNGIEIAKTQENAKRSVLDSVENAFKKIEDKIFGNKVVDAVLSVLAAPIEFAGYALSRIFYRSSFLQKLNENLETFWAKRGSNLVAKSWARETGASAFAEKQAVAELFDFFTNSSKKLERTFAEKNAREWAQEVGASVEDKNKYVDKLLYREKVQEDYYKLTRNELKKKYPHINADVVNTQTSQRSSVARFITSLRGYRVPNDPVELYAFRLQLNAQLGIKKSIYWGAEQLDGINTINRQLKTQSGVAR